MKKTDVNDTQFANTLPEEGLVRLRQIIGVKREDGTYEIPPVIPVSKSTWWQGVKDGVYPKPSKKFGQRCTCWNVVDIRRIIEKQAEPHTEDPNVPSQ